MHSYCNYVSMCMLCNSRMAQMMQWLQAIQSCMGKVRLHISTVYGQFSLAIINGPHPGVWPEVFIKRGCALSTLAFGLAPVTAYLAYLITSSPRPISK